MQEIILKTLQPEIIGTVENSGIPKNNHITQAKKLGYASIQRSSILVYLQNKEIIITSFLWPHCSALQDLSSPPRIEPRLRQWYQNPKTMDHQGMPTSY